MLAYHPPNCWPNSDGPTDGRTDDSPILLTTVFRGNRHERTGTGINGQFVQWGDPGEDPAGLRQFAVVTKGTRARDFRGSHARRPVENNLIA